MAARRRRSTPRARSATVAYAVTDATERYADVAEVTIVVWADQPKGAASDAAIPVSGTVRLPGPAATVHWHDAATGRATIDGSTVHLAGSVAAHRPSTLVVTVPAAAVPDLRVLRDEPGADYLEGRQAQLDAEDGQVGRRLRDEQRRQDRLAEGYWALVGVEIGIPLLVVGFRLARAGHRRLVAEAGIPHISSEPPGDESPALIALLHDDGHDIGREAVAATILDLVRRKVIGMDGITSDRWVIDVGRSDAQPTRPGEAAVVTALQAQADPQGHVTGPPLPLDPDGAWWHALRVDVVAQARAARLLRRRYPSGLFLTSVVALTLTTAPLWFRTPAAAAGGLAIAVVFVALPFAGGFVLTPQGLRRRAAWRSFGRYIHDQGNLADVPPTGIAIWGPYLSHGAALGEAPAAVTGLSPARPRSADRGAAGTTTLGLLLAVGLTAALVAGGAQPTKAGAEPGPVGPLPESAVGSRSDFRTARPDLDAIQDELAGIDLTCQDLSGFEFGQATLTGAVLAKARLDGADLVQAHLDGADLRGVSAVDAHFGQATIAGGHLEGADLTKADLGQATLTDGRLEGADLSKADLGQTNLTGAVLDGAVLKGASLTQTTVDGASFAEVDLSGSELTGIGLDGVDLHGAKLRGSDLTFGSFTRADLREADFSDTTMFSADFTKADGRGADFSGAKLSSVTFDGADMTGASFRGADLGGSSAAQAIFKDVDLTDATGTSALDAADLAGAKGLPTSNALPWLLGIGGVLLLAILAGVVVVKSRGIAADA